MRAPKPWYRSSTDAWYVCLRGKQILLAKGKRNKASANRAFKRLQAGEMVAVSSPNDPPLSVAVVLDNFLEHIKDRRSFKWYQQLLQDFAFTYGSLLAPALMQEHITDWLAKKTTWGPTTKNKVIGILKQAFKWATEQGQLPRNPAATIKKPRARRRDRILSTSERLTIWNAARGKPFKNLVTALQETGARPGEIAKVTAADLDLKNWVWVLQEHKTAHATTRPRIIYLTPKMTELCRELSAKHPDGPLFRNSRGKPWTSNAIRIRFRNLRRKLKLKGVVAYSYRHTFATDGLERGVPIATMAELLGHTSTTMLSSFYAHLSQKGAYLRQAVIDATAATATECAATQRPV